TLVPRLTTIDSVVHLRIDTIEHTLRQAGSLIAGSEGYSVAYRLAEDNLRLGLSVVADSVNPLQITRMAWREVALRVREPFVEIEIICSDVAEHQHRSRNSALQTFLDLSFRLGKLS
ncbi:MAG: hypothetical protein HC936_18950, partial [Leptolyngbyaceae cyanobacterium SU_3_3]|nr:hypothetical protein [Leptolyngbyaceae cyanobacterium SU_3_3]